MEFLQYKLTRDEWNNLEIPVNDTEREILNMIINGYNDIDIVINDNLSLMSVIKLDNNNNNAFELYLFNKYFKDEIKKINKKYHIDKEDEFETIKLQKIRSTESVKINNFDNNIELFKSSIFEFVVLDMYKSLIKAIHKNKSSTIAIYVYTIIQLFKTKIKNINKYFKEYINDFISNLLIDIQVKDVINKADVLIEKNGYLLQYEDKELFEHQKQIYNIFKQKSQNTSDLVLYTAPTGTGKTLTPLGLSNEYKIIFVCVARHIGLALAKSAISMNKKIAFAFGCDTANNIRLHNFSVAEYLKKDDGNYIKFKDGKKKIDHENGSNVDIMICDLKSYISAMHYMLAFHDKNKIIMYWDEPTITLDHESHELHDTITKIWNENKIRNIIMSSATLPELNSINKVVNNFKNRFENPNVHYIRSYEFKKSIPIIDTQLCSISIHTMHENYNDMKNCINYILSNNQTLLRYIDLKEIVDFIKFCMKNIKITNTEILNYFENDICKVNMKSLKLFYLHLLSCTDESTYNTIYKYFAINKNKKYNTKGNGILFTTHDAITLTNGPTIFICEDAHKIASFYIQQSKIPDDKFNEIMKKISFNEKLQKDITILEKKLALIEEKNDTALEDRSNKETNEMKDLHREINRIRSKILLINLDDQFVPNTKSHQMKWNNKVDDSAFIPKIDEIFTKKIMELEVSNSFKVLLLLGIGVFIKDSVLDYQELMKKLATEQKLFMIIASSDYIYGTNYQFCHGIIGKDLSHMTQEKTLQSLGRIGRNNIQQNYSVRFRNNDLIYNLFKPSDNNIEAENMNKLLS
jgi:hypothetical protein